MDPAELEATYTDEGHLSYDFGENDNDDYPGSEDNQSGEDGDANRESDDAGEALDNASVDDMDIELSDDVVSDSSPIASSDDDQEDEQEAESETISVENNDSGSDEERSEVVGDDIGADDDAELIDEEVVDTASDKSSLDSEANDTSEEGATVNTAAESVGEIGIFDKDSTTHQEHDSILTSTRSASRGWVQFLKGQSAINVPPETTYQAYQPTNNDQSKNTYQSFNNHRTADKNRKKIVRSLPEAPALLDTSSLHKSHTSAGVQNPTGSKKLASKMLKDTVLKSTTLGTTEASPMTCRKPKGKHFKLPIYAKRHRTSEKTRKFEFSNETDGVHELYVPDGSAQLTEATRMPEAARNSPVFHEMESMPVLTASHKASKAKQQPTVHELEGALCHVPNNSKQNVTIHELEGATSQTLKITRKHSTIHELDSVAAVTAGHVPSRSNL